MASQRIYWQSLVAGGLMLLAAVAAVLAKPTVRAADRSFSLEAAIPSQFGDWHLDRTVIPVEPAPDVLEKLGRIYSQTLGRTYVNSQGQRIMLSVAYGGDQSDGMRAHRPEVCYAAQGFEVSAKRREVLQVGALSIPTRQLTARQEERIEPITYWMVVGDRVVGSGVEQKLAQLASSFHGVVPDGVLMRVSSIDPSPEHAWKLHATFVAALFPAVDPQQRRRFFGAVGAGGGLQVAVPPPRMLAVR
jgi:EpsI family protein